MPYNGETPEETKKIESCVAGITGVNPRTKKPYTKSEKIAICKSSILKKSDKVDNELQKLHDNLIHLSIERPSKIELVEDLLESPTYKIKFELMDVAEYNRFEFTLENLQFMVKEFKEDDVGLVSHGLDHSLKTLEQLGKVYDLQFDDSTGKARVFAFSELFKETEAQKQAYILFKQGLLNFVSGGWKPKKFFWNDKKDNISMVEPKLKEISSTPVPAKRDAKIQDVLNSLNNAPEMEEIITDAIPENNLEEKDMTEEQVTKPSPEGDEIKGLRAEFTALKTEVDTTKKELEATKNEQMAQNKVSLLARAKELGLAEDDFKGMNNAEIEKSLSVANKVQMSTLRKSNPDIPIGAEGQSFADGSTEMAKFLEKKYFDWGDVPAEKVV